MKLRIPSAALLLTLSSTVGAANYATCLLDKLPGLENDHAASAAATLCRSEHPGGLSAIPLGDGRGLTGYDSGAECALDLSGATRSRDAAYMIRAACNRLYNAPPKPVPLFDDLKPKSKKEVAIQPSDEAKAHFDRIYAVHPDADAVVTSSSFTAWVSRDSERNRIASQGTSDEVIALLTEFKSLPIPPQPPAPPQKLSTPVDAYPDCKFKQIMTDDDYHACGIKPAGS